jgi:hypothetical protein
VWVPIISYFFFRIRRFLPPLVISSLRYLFNSGHDEYTQNKLIRYQVLVRRTSLFSLAIIGAIYHDHENGSNWADLLGYNIIDKCGDLEIGFEKHLSEFLKNTSIDRDQEDSLVERLENWQIKSKSHDYYAAKNLGICNVVKRIPQEGPLKFLKLGRPGFDYDKKERDFVLPELYNYVT